MRERLANVLIFTTVMPAFFAMIAALWIVSKVCPRAGSEITLAILKGECSGD